MCLLPFFASGSWIKIKLFSDWTSNKIPITVLIECIISQYLFQFGGALIPFSYRFLSSDCWNGAALWILLSTNRAPTSNRGIWLTREKKKRKIKRLWKTIKINWKEINKRLLKKNGSLYHGTFSEKIRNILRHYYYVIAITSFVHCNQYSMEHAKWLRHVGESLWTTAVSTSMWQKIPREKYRVENITTRKPYGRNLVLRVVIVDYLQKNNWFLPSLMASIGQFHTVILQYINSIK